MQEPMNPQPRRSTLGMHLLRRSKSGDLGKGQRKSKDRVRRDSISKVPPKLPDLVQQTPNLERLSSAFGRDDGASIMSGGTAVYSPRPSMDPGRGGSYIVGAPPVPPMPAWDPYSQAESMAHRGRYSYASTAMSTVNSPRRVRRRKDPTPFNILIVGARNSGKTSFLEFLKTALALPQKKRSRKTLHEDEQQPVYKAVRRGNFVPHYLETELDGERVGLTIWDSEGFEKNVVDLQLRELSSFVESKFEDTLNEEMKVVRSPGFQDTHIHAVFLVLDPSRLDRNLAAARSMASSASSPYYNGNDPFNSPPHGAGALDDDLDLQVVRTLQGKTTVIPVISKADTITIKHMAVLKRSVWDSLKKANLDPLEALGMDEDDDDSAIDTSRIEEEDEGADAHSAALSFSDDMGDQAHVVDDQAEVVDGQIVNGQTQIVDDQVPPLRSANAKSLMDERAMNIKIQIEAKIMDKMSPDDRRTSPTSPASKRLSSSSIRRHKAQEDAKVDDEVPFLPLSIISPDLYEPSVVGRKFPWGFADPYDEKHCDFVRLREAVFYEWRPELREASREQWYEGWRTSRLRGGEAK